MKANTEFFPRLCLMIDMKVNLSNNLNGSRFTWHQYWFDLSILDLLTMKLIKCEVYSLFSGIQYSTKTFSIDVFEKKRKFKVYNYRNTRCNGHKKNCFIPPIAGSQ